MVAHTENVFDALDGAQIAHKMPRMTRLLLWCFGRRLNRDLFYPVLGRAYERGIINSRQLHSLHRHFDPTQHGAVGVAK